MAAGPVSRIRRTAMQTDKLFEISRCDVSMMSILVVMVGFASHRRHSVVPEDCPQQFKTAVDDSLLECHVPQPDLTLPSGQMPVLQLPFVR